MGWKATVFGLLTLFSSVLCQSREIQFACGQNQPLQLTSSQGNIYSPGFLETKKYPPNSQCSYYIQVPRYRKVMIEIKHMDLEATENCQFDFVQIIDAQKQLLLGRYCGSNITEKFLVDANVVHINFESDHIISGKGFHIAYQLTTQTSFCQPRDLHCKNNKCVTRAAICNLKDDCGDGTDEEDCRKKRNQEVECGVPRIAPDLELGHDRIVGGYQAIPGSWPWQADMQIVSIHPSGHRCGGTLINSQWVVTAAHCFLQYPMAEAWRIHLGNHHKFTRDASEQIRYPKAIHFFNPRFREDEHDLMINDIALIKLNAEVEFTSQVSPVCLPPSGFEIPVGTKCYSSGWGMSRGSGGSGVLKQTSVIILNSQKCINNLTPINDKTMVCTSEDDGNGGICHGDSGGPLVCEIKKKWYLIGISSFGTDATPFGGMCGVKDAPTVYQKVSSKVPWIQSILKRYG